MHFNVPCQHCGHCPACGQPIEQQRHFDTVPLFKPIGPFNPTPSVPWVWPDWPNPYIGDGPPSFNSVSVRVTLDTKTDMLENVNRIISIVAAGNTGDVQ